MKKNYHILNINLTAITVDDLPQSDVPCNGCSFCCQQLSPYLTPEEITSGKYPISLVQPSEQEIQEVNAGPTVVLFMNKNRGCSMLLDNQCLIYNDRPLACRQFDCRKGHHPKIPDMTKE